jgi:hypothetical protein
MRVLKGILKDSLKHYQRQERQLRQQIAKLPRGSIKPRRLKGQVYYYYQERQGPKVVHRYLGRRKPEQLLAQIQQRRRLRSELSKVRAALRLIDQRKLRS